MFALSPKRRKVSHVHHPVAGQSWDFSVIESIPPPQEDDVMCDVDFSAAEEVFDEESESDKKYDEYLRQFKESDGFGYIYFPNFLASGMVRMQPENETVFRRYSPHAALAINYYNKKNGTNFLLRCVERVNLQSGLHDELYITFKATNNDVVDVATAMKTFQAKVIDDVTGYVCSCGSPEIIIDFCRLKPATGQVACNLRGEEFQQLGNSSKDCESSNFTISLSTGFTKPSTLDETLTDENEYAKQVEESDGFDVGNITNGVASGMTTMLPCAESVFREYTPHATLAIMFYSQTNNANFEFKGIEKVKKESAQYDELYITLQATNKDAVDAATATKTFEAKVIVDYNGYLSSSGSLDFYSSCHEPRITFELCRLKPTTH